MVIADTPQKIELYRMHVLHKMLKLELVGIKMNRGGQPTAYSVIKREFNLKGDRQKVYDAMTEIINTIQQQEGEA
jgi:hypothetical protein